MRQIKKGSTNISVDLYIIDATDGTPETGVVFDTAGIDLKYRRQGEAVVDITEVTLAALTTAHADGGFLEIGFGSYRLDLPDAAVDTGADKVTAFGTITGMIVLPVEIQLVDNTEKDVYDRIGASGASLTDLGGMATAMKAEVNAEADTALSDYGANTTVPDAAGTAPTAVENRAEMDSNSTKLSSISTDAARLTAARAAVLTDWIDTGRLDLILDAIPTTAMRGTDNAATETKQDIMDINIDQIEAVVITNAAGVDIAADIIALKTVADAIPTTVMRGTDIGDLNNISSANVLTEAKNALDTVIPASPTGGSINDVLDIQKDATVSGLAQTGTLNTTTMTTDLSETTDDHYNGRIIVFRGGILDGQATDITDYSGTNGTITMTAVTEAPLNNQAFIIV